MAGPDDLFDLALELLVASVDAVGTTAAGWSAASPAYVSPGPPAFDCEQITVHAGGPREADTSPLSPPLAAMHRIEKVAIVPLVDFTVTILRCVAVLSQEGQAPTDVEIEADARKTYADIWALWNVLRTRVRDETDGLFRRPDGQPREIQFGAASPVLTSGAIGGWQAPISLSLEGYVAV